MASLQHPFQQSQKRSSGPADHGDDVMMVVIMTCSSGSNNNTNVFVQSERERNMRGGERGARRTEYLLQRSFFICYY